MTPGRHWLAAGIVLLAGVAGCAREEGRIESLADAAHARIGVLTGSTGEAIVKARFTAADVKSFDDFMDTVAAMKAGQLDAAVIAYPTAMQVTKKNTDLRIIAERLDDEPTAMAVRKEDTALLAELNQQILALRADGTLADLKRRWLKSDLGPYEELKPEPPPAGPALRVGVAATREPISFTDATGRVTGHDGELARLVGQRLGRPVEFSDMKFMALIPALQSHKIDVIITGMTATAERSRQVSFSATYFDNAQVMLVRATGAAASAPGKPSFVQGVVQSFRSNILHERRYLLIWEGLKTTIGISVAATIFGTLLGALVCYMRMSPRMLLHLPARVFIATLRGTPVLVVLMLVFYVVFASVDINPVLVAVIAFGMNFAAYVAEIFRTGIEGVDRGQTEAGLALGFSRTQTFGYVVLPQTVRRILPVYKGEFISLVKMTSIVGYIAVQDLTKAGDIIRARTFDAFFPLIMIAILYFVISWSLLEALERLERLTDPRQRRARARRA